MIIINIRNHATCSYNSYSKSHTFYCDYWDFHRSKQQSGEMKATNEDASAMNNTHLARGTNVPAARRVCRLTTSLCSHIVSQQLSRVHGDTFDTLSFRKPWTGSLLQKRFHDNSHGKGSPKKIKERQKTTVKREMEKGRDLFWNWPVIYT